jgi:hypothetical protein
VIGDRAIVHDLWRLVLHSPPLFVGYRKPAAVPPLAMLLNAVRWFNTIVPRNVSLDT